MNDELPSVISGTRRQYRELVDGSIRVQIDIDPRFKADFHRLFPNIDTPCALAPLALNFERIEEQHREEKVGPLCKLACMWCADNDFRAWLAMEVGADYLNEKEAANALRNIMRVKSRREFDDDPEAGERFRKDIRAPFMEWMDR